MKTSCSIIMGKPRNSIPFWIASCLLLVVMCTSYKAKGAVYSVNVNMKWSDLGTLIPPFATPTTNDIIDVSNGITLTVDVPNAECASIDVGWGGIILFNPASELTVGAGGNGVVTLGANGMNAFIDMTVGGTLNCGRFSISNPNGNIFTAQASTVKLNTNAVTDLPAAIYESLTISGTGTVDLTGSITVTGDLNISSGASINTVLPTNTITLHGNLVNNGTMILNGSTFTMSGHAFQDIGGTTSTTFGTLIIDNPSAGVTISTDIYVDDFLELDNYSTVSPSASSVIGGMGTLSGTGTIKVTRSTGSNDFDGQFAIANKTLTNLTVEFAGSANQGNGTSSFTNLTINNSSGVTAKTDLTVSGSFALLKGHYILENKNLTMGSSASFDGGSSSSYVRVNGSGRVIVSNVGSSSFTFPIGYNPYLPVTVSSPGGNVDFTIGVHSGITDSTSAPIASDAVNLTWEIIPSANVSGVELTLQWPSTTELSGFSNASCLIAMRDASNKAWGSTQMPQSASSPSAGVYSLSTTIPIQMSANTAYYFGVMETSGTPLPVKLTNFGGTVQGEDVLLSWTTAMEENNNFFEVQRSADGKSWEGIAHFPGTGTTAKTTIYSHTDINVFSHENKMYYYRLKQVDYNGAADYSQVISVRYADRWVNEASINVYPNPGTEINISTNAIPEGAIIRLISYEGRVIAEKVLTADMMSGFQLNEITNSPLSAGAYMLNISSGKVNINRLVVKK